MRPSSAAKSKRSGTTGIPGFRTDDYLPVGVTARTRVASHRALSINLEYDHLIRGWQTARNSRLGSGDVPATTTAPAFTIEGFTDISFAQHGGWALRAGASYQVTRRWSVEPYYVHWNISDSPVSDGTLTFTVNNVTARQQPGFHNPGTSPMSLASSWASISERLKRSSSASPDH